LDLAAGPRRRGDCDGRRCGGVLAPATFPAVTFGDAVPDMPPWPTPACGSVALDPRYDVALGFARAGHLTDMRWWCSQRRPGRCRQASRDHPYPEGARRSPEGAPKARGVTAVRTWTATRLPEDFHSPFHSPYFTVIGHFHSLFHSPWFSPFHSPFPIACLLPCGIMEHPPSACDGLAWGRSHSGRGALAL
jgi:hypothetical protein